MAALRDPPLGRALAGIAKSNSFLPDRALLNSDAASRLHQLHLPTIIQILFSSSMSSLLPCARYADYLLCEFVRWSSRAKNSAALVTVAPIALVRGAIYHIMKSAAEAIFGG
jgi:hypothetical protein